MNILFVTPAPQAGSQQYTHQLANALVQLDHRVAVATATDYEMKAYPRRYHAIEVFDGFATRPSRLLYFLRRLRSFRPEIVHYLGAQQPTAYLAFAQLIRLFSEAAFVFTPQDVLPNIRKRIDQWALPALYRRMRHVFIHAKQNRDIITKKFGVDPAKVTLVPIPDHLAFIRDDIVPIAPSIPAGRRLVLCFGLIEPRKGIHTLIASFPKVLEQVPDAFLLIAGRPYMDVEPLRQAISEFGLAETATLLPRYLSFEEMAGLFDRAELLVLPYDSGWNSGVLATALAQSKPIVATHVGGFAEVIENEVNGLLVPPKDPDALATAIIQTLNDQAYRARLAEELPRRANAHSWEQLASTSQSVYRQVSESHRPQRG